MSLVIRCDLTTAFKNRSDMKPGKAKLKQDKEFKIRADKFYFHIEKVCIESHNKTFFNNFQKPRQLSLQHVSQEEQRIVKKELEKMKINFI